tara:strand:+ start:48 stop:578 length:531 start_codon:yes stop_codon:yes gene_type:complete
MLLRSCIIIGFAALSMGCSSLAVTEQFGAPSEKLSPRSRAYRHHILSQVLNSNRCPSGYSEIQGQWRIQGDFRGGSLRDEIVFRGAEFTQFTAEENTDKKEYGIFRGRYACIDGGKLVFFLESVEPDGAFGNKRADAYPCQLFWRNSVRGENLALLCNFEWNPNISSGYTYQRIGN